MKKNKKIFSYIILIILNILLMISLSFNLIKKDMILRNKFNYIHKNEYN